MIAGSVNGVADAKARYQSLVARTQPLYDANMAYYRELDERTASVVTPDVRLNTAFRWAKVGIDKGFATNPQLGTGLVAGFRTSGDSERPGFAWFFGRDALWTALAITSYGDFAGTRTALDFLTTFQRADGKVPHEISQSAAIVPWFTDYGYPWASADATPLFVIAHADYWRASGDVEYLRKSWPAIVKAHAFTAGTDADRNGLIDNTGVGHGWVEGGALYPPHEEIYMQGVWIEASRAFADMADALGDASGAASARAAAERTRTATEATYWLADRGFYAFATATPRDTPAEAEPGPSRDVRQARLNALQRARIIDEDTVLPAVPLWWRTLDAARAQLQIDHLGSASMATDWGARLLSNQSRLYDPLSYHYGSVWPLFTGWASMGAYQYGRSHVGYQALMANALLTDTGALGYVTELLSGDFNAAFGRSSHHQVWSEAMVITPVIRGLLGWEAGSGGRRVRVAPQLPIHWERVEARSLPAGQARVDMVIARAPERLTMTFRTRGATGAALEALVLAPAVPLDAVIRGVTANGRTQPFKIIPMGDGQQIETTVRTPADETTVVFTYTDGTDVYQDAAVAELGAASQALRILRSRASASGLELVLEGLVGRAYRLAIRTPRSFAKVPGITLTQLPGQDRELQVSFEGEKGSYVRRTISLPFAKGR